MYALDSDQWRATELEQPSGNGVIFELSRENKQSMDITHHKGMQREFTELC